MTPLLRDVRYAGRMLFRNPGFTAIALLTFAVGIGVNTAVFSVFNGVLLRPLPYPDADRIVLMWLDNQREGIKEDIGSYPIYRDWREQATSFEHVGAYTPSNFTLTGADEPERILGANTTENFFAIVGLQPVMGRLYTEAHEVPGNDRVVLISHGLWMRKFGGSGDVLGKTMTLDGNPHEIIGVMPPELRLPANAQLWKPLAPSEELRNARFAFWLPVIGKLKPGVTVEQAQTEMSGIASRLQQAYPQLQGFGSYVVSLHKQIVGQIERSLQVLMAAVLCVLLIACANLGNLMLGRTAARRKELAIRTALGARRGRLIRQIVTETFVLALAGSALGLLLAFWATEFFVALAGATIPRPDAIVIDGRVMLFTLLLAMIASLLAGLIPALQASRLAVREHLQEGGREGGGGGSRRTRSVLIAAEMALAFVLLAGAGILVRTLWSMEQVDRGFSTDRIAVARLSLPQTLFAGPPEVRSFYARLLERVRALPGVESAATATGVLQPLVTNSGVYSIEGKPLPPPEQRVEFPVEIVSPGFFETLGIQFAAGRPFDEKDHAEAPRSVIINETLARLGWPGEDPIGRRMRAGGENSSAPWMVVVGVIKDVRRGEVTRAIRPELYMSALQVTPRTQMLVVRTAGDPSAILPTIRKEVQALNPQLPLFATGTLEAQVSETLTEPRFRALLLAGFAVIALLLASIGIYGVTAHAVGQRTQEVGVRMALGAQRADVLLLILRQHLRPALIGVALGLGGALALARFLESMVYGVRATDPSTFLLMGLTLLSVAVAACWIPARRATRVDALVALRNQ
ncbi:MAG TPA: ABC transporter permease [Vicinamibacterales bacterium]|nr:ABC transporter permease [Vicinamibacterales bacterium]